LSLGVGSVRRDCVEDRRCTLVRSFDHHVVFRWHFDHLASIGGRRLLTVTRLVEV